MIIPEKDYPKRQLQRDCQSLTDQLLWQIPLSKEVIYHQPLPFSHWDALLMTRYQPQAVEQIQTLAKIDRFFYQHKVNRFKQLSIWCIRPDVFPSLLDQLQTLTSIEIQPLETITPC